MDRRFCICMGGGDIAGMVTMMGKEGRRHGQWKEVREQRVQEARNVICLQWCKLG